MLFKKMVYLFPVLVSNVFGLSNIFVVSPEAEHFKAQAKILRNEIKIMEKNLLKERKERENVKLLDSYGNLEILSKNSNTMIPYIFLVKVNEKSKMNLYWELENYGEARVKLIDRKGYILGHAFGRWKKVSSKFGIGSKIILYGRGTGFSVSCKFTAISRINNRHAKHKYNQYSNHLKKLKQYYGIMENYDKEVLDLDPPVKLFPLISTKSLVSIYTHRLKNFCRRMSYMFTHFLIRSRITYIENIVNKWKDIAYMSVEDKYIKLNKESYIIKNSGNINLRGFVSISNTWAPIPRNRLQSYCYLEYINIIKKRTGGRIGGRIHSL
jgi:hypothetical protein